MRNCVGDAIGRCATLSVLIGRYRYDDVPYNMANPAQIERAIGPRTTLKDAESFFDRAGTASGAEQWPRIRVPIVLANPRG